MIIINKLKIKKVNISIDNVLKIQALIRGWLVRKRVKFLKFLK